MSERDYEGSFAEAINNSKYEHSLSSLTHTTLVSRETCKRAEWALNSGKFWVHHVNFRSLDNEMGYILTELDPEPCDRPRSAEYTAAAKRFNVPFTLREKELRNS